MSWPTKKSTRNVDPLFLGSWGCRNADGITSDELPRAYSLMQVYLELNLPTSEELLIFASHQFMDYFLQGATLEAPFFQDG